MDFLNGRSRSMTMSSGSSPSLRVSVGGPCNPTISAYAIHGHQIIATAEASRMGDGTWYLNRVFVRPEHRGKRWGVRVLDRLLQQADNDVIVDPGGYGSDPDALANFYAKMGFKQTPLKGRMRWPHVNQEP